MGILKLPESETEYRNALVEAAEVGAMKALIDADILKPDMSLREAQRKYGIAIVNRWIKEKLITVRKDGPRNSKTRIDRVTIEAVAKASNRATYITAKERKQL